MYSTHCILFLLRLTSNNLEMRTDSWHGGDYEELGFPGRQRWNKCVLQQGWCAVKTHTRGWQPHLSGLGRKRFSLEHWPWRSGKSCCHVWAMTQTERNAFPWWEVNTYSSPSSRWENIREKSTPNQVVGSPQTPLAASEWPSLGRGRGSGEKNYGPNAAGEKAGGWPWGVCHKTLFLVYLKSKSYLGNSGRALCSTF